MIETWIEAMEMDSDIIISNAGADGSFSRVGGGGGVRPLLK